MEFIKKQRTIWSFVVTMLVVLGMEAVLYYPERLSLVVAVSFVSLAIALGVSYRVTIRSFSPLMYWFVSMMYAAGSFLGLLFVGGQLYQQLFIGFTAFVFFALVRRLMAMKVVEIQKMAYGQQYSYVDFVLLLTSFLFYSGFFGFYLHVEAFELWHLMLSVLLINGFLFFLFFYFNDLWFKKIWVYVFVLTFIVLEVTWTLSFWPTGLLGRGVVLFFVYYLMSGLGKHYLKETFSMKVLRQYAVVGVMILFLILTTIEWTY